MRLAQDGGFGLRGDLMDRGLVRSVARRRKRAADAVESGVEVPERRGDHQRADAFQRLADGLAAGNFGDAGAVRCVLQDDDDAGEVRAVCTGEIQQHAVMAGDRDDLHIGDGRSIRGCADGWCIHVRSSGVAGWAIGTTAPHVPACGSGKL